MVKTLVATPDPDPEPEPFPSIWFPSWSPAQTTNLGAIQGSTTITLSNFWPRG